MAKKLITYKLNKNRQNHGHETHWKIRKTFTYDRNLKIKKFESKRKLSLQKTK